MVPKHLPQRERVYHIGEDPGMTWFCHDLLLGPGEYGLDMDLLESG